MRVPGGEQGNWGPWIVFPLQNVVAWCSNRVKLHFKLYDNILPQQWCLFSQKLHPPLFRARPEPPFGACPFERRGFLSLAVFANALYVEAMIKTQSQLEVRMCGRLLWCIWKVQTLICEQIKENNQYHTLGIQINFTKTLPMVVV